MEQLLSKSGIQFETVYGEQVETFGQSPRGSGYFQVQVTKTTSKGAVRKTMYFMVQRQPHTEVFFAADGEWREFSLVMSDIVGIN